MYYDRFSEKNELILLGHMCNLKVPIDKISDFLYFLSDNNIKATFSYTIEGAYCFISIYSPTLEISQDTYEILLKWNP